MKKLILPVFFAMAASVSLAVQEGDTYEQVIAEKGKPASKVEMGSKLILNYPDVTIRFDEGKVIQIKAAGGKVASAVSVTAPASQAGQWTTAYTAALGQAKNENRLSFLFFTGSDWCGWCHRLEDEILSTAEFKRFAAERLVLVKLDFPKAVPQPEALRNQNQTLGQKYAVRGYPTVVVLNSAGRQVGELGYQEGGPGPFIAALKKMQ